MSMSSQRIAQVASVCLRKAGNVSANRAEEIAGIVSRGYFKVIQESEEWKNSTGVCNIDSLEPLIKNLLGRDASRILEGLTDAERRDFGFASPSQEEELCFVWAWRAFCLLGRQFHHSHVTPKELVCA